jgi:hypothetical protein
MGEGLGHTLTADPIHTAVGVGVASVLGVAGYVRYRVQRHTQDELLDRASESTLRYQVLKSLLGNRDVTFFTAKGFAQELKRVTVGGTNKPWDERTLDNAAEEALKALVDQKVLEAPKAMLGSDNRVALYYAFQRPAVVPPDSKENNGLPVTGANTDEIRS